MMDNELVMDSGVGIPADQTEKIFDLFYLADRTTQQTNKYERTFHQDINK